jgi:hypothetical protein
MPEQTHVPATGMAAGTNAAPAAAREPTCPRDASGGGLPAAPANRERHRRAPVMLVTFDSAAFDPEGVAFAVETALECGRALVVVNAFEYRPGRCDGGGGAPPYPPAVEQALRAPAELAAGLGVHVQRLRVLSPRPVVALLALVAERRPAVVAFAPDSAALRRFRRPTRRRHHRFLSALEQDAPCLLWTPQAPVVDAVSSAARPSSRARPAPIRRARPGSATTIANPMSSQIATTNGKRS